jgi:4-hydroxy-3-polyprenylbenzoate decarboxylase
MVAAHCHAGAYCNRWTIVVDEDIDPTNVNDVIWAMCTRCDPRDQVDLIHGGWSSALDPMCYDTEADRRNSRVVIDACIPFRRKKSFPTIARSSKALDDRIRAKWAKDLPKGFS